MAVLGKLEMVNDLRQGWEREDADFTPWLSQEENLSILGKEIGIPVQLVKTEYTVGPFSADIVAKHPDTDEIVVIENQFPKQIMTIWENC